MKPNKAVIRTILFWLLIGAMICAALALYTAAFISGGGFGSP